MVAQISSSIAHKLDAIIRSAEVLSSEYILVATILLLVILEIAKPSGTSVLSLYITMFASFLLFLNVLSNVRTGSFGTYFSDHVAINSYTYLGQLALSSCLFIVILFDLGKKRAQHGEYYILLLGATLGGFVLVTANTLLTLYIGVELLSLCSYLLATFGFQKKSFEGGIKYLVFGSVSTAFMLYGMSMVYGLTGDLSYEALQTAFGINRYAFIYVLFILGGVLFKVSAFPFHAWVPDVYQAAPVPVTAFFSVSPKVAGVFALVNVLSTNNFLHQDMVITVLAIIVMGSIFIGNLSALLQSNLKRLLAYSSIAHAGFILIGVFVVPESNFTSLCFYVLVYLLMNLSIFYIVNLLERNDISTLSELNGIGKKHPVIGVLIVIVMISLAGLPPTAGFTAKLLVFISLWSKYSFSGQPILLALFIIGLVNTVISLYYYIRIAFHLFIKPTENDVSITFTWYSHGIAVLLTLPLLLIFAKPDFLLNFINTIISLGG